MGKNKHGTINKGNCFHSVGYSQSYWQRGNISFFPFFTVLKTWHFPLMSQSLPPPPHRQTHRHYPPSPVVRKECLSCRSNGSWDDWSGGKETRVMIKSTVWASMHTFVHACAVCMSQTCGCTTDICVCVCPFLRVNSLYMHVCVSVALQQWRHQDTWHHTDVTQHSTPQDTSDSLTWKMRHRREHQQAQGKPNPTSACCCTETVSATSFLLWINSRDRDTAQAGGIPMHTNSFLQ